jgi:hypothetical protein
MAATIATRQIAKAGGAAGLAEHEARHARHLFRLAETGDRLGCGNLMGQVLGHGRANEQFTITLHAGRTVAQSGESRKVASESACHEPPCQH